MTLLTKLGIKPLSEMTDDEVTSLISSDRLRRSQQRAIGRAKRIMTESKKPKSNKVVTLESIGLAPHLVKMLRGSGKPDGEIIGELRLKGII